VQIEVQPADTAAAATAAAELARRLRKSADRLAAACPAESGSAPLAAWISTWQTLREGLLGLAAAADDLATLSAAAAATFRATETEVLSSENR
jgi:hypothetical protein